MGLVIQPLEDPWFPTSSFSGIWKQFYSSAGVMGKRRRSDFFKKKKNHHHRHTREYFCESCFTIKFPSCESSFGCRRVPLLLFPFLPRLVSIVKKIKTKLNSEKLQLFVSKAKAGKKKKKLRKKNNNNLNHVRLHNAVILIEPVMLSVTSTLF